MVVEADRRKLDAMSLTHSHQGVIAVAAAQPYATVEGHPPRRRGAGGEAAAGGVRRDLRPPQPGGHHPHGGVRRGPRGDRPKRRSAGLTAVVAKTSAGAVSYLPVARVPNIAALLADLKKRGIWVFGAAAEGSVSLYDADLAGPAAIVIGSEGDGMTRLVRESCDFLVSIPMKGRISSLNASAAAAVLLYEALRQRLGG